MCIVFFIFGHPKYKLVLASNRDESLKRPTQAADFWNIDENIISAIDLATITHINKPNKDLNNKKSTKLKRCSPLCTINNYEKQLLDEILKQGDISNQSSLSEFLNKESDPSSGDKLKKYQNINDIYKTEKKITGYGTWLGCTRQGLFSTLTNFREDPKKMNPNAVSRGYLVRDFLLLKSLYNRRQNIKKSRNNINNNSIANTNSSSTKLNTKSTNAIHRRIRMHHPRRQAPEKILKRFEEEDKLYAMEDKNVHNGADKIFDEEDSKLSPTDDDLIDFPYEYMKYVDKSKDKYNGFNLIVGDISLPEPSVWYIGNNEDCCTEKLKKNTVYGISNGSLNTYWKKVDRGKKLFAKAIENHSDLNDLVHKLLNVLNNKKDVPLDKLPKTAFGPKLEKCCAPICIEKGSFNGTVFGNDYATRTHTVIIVDNNNNVTFVEQDHYDTITDNFIMKQECYVPLIENINSDSSNSLKPNNDEPISTTIRSPYTNITTNSNSNDYNYLSNPINIPNDSKKIYDNSYGSPFKRAYTTSFASSSNPFFISPSSFHHSFDNLNLKFSKYNPNSNNLFNSSPMSVSSLGSIISDTLEATSVSSFNSFPSQKINNNNNIITINNNIVPISPDYNSPYHSFPSLLPDIHYDSYNHMDNDNVEEKEDEKMNSYEEDQLENMSIESPTSSNTSPTKSPIKLSSKSPIAIINNNNIMVEKESNLSSRTPITPVFNFFESINSNDYKDKPLQSQFVKRNVHDLSKANIHQFKLKI